MEKKSTDACPANPKADGCDIVQYADELNEKAQEENEANLTVGKQPGFTQKAEDDIVKERE